MAPPKLSTELLKQCVEAYLLCKRNMETASRTLGMSRGTLQHRLRCAVREGFLDTDKTGPIGPLKVDDIAKARIEKLEAELGFLREERRRLLDETTDLTKIKQLIHDCDYAPKPPKWMTPKFTPNLTGVPHLLLSDWHWDEVVAPEQVNGVNAYNREIAVRRLQTCFQKTVVLLTEHMRRPTYDYAVVMLNGDMISGNIHEELRETNETPVAQSVLHMVDHLIAGLTLLHNKFGKLYIPCVVGNHGRFDKKPRAKNRAYDSHEFYLYHFLARHFKREEGFHFEIADGAFLPFTTYQTRFLMAHGDQAKGGSGIAGALSPLMLMDHRTRKRAMAVDQPYDYLLLGHWHQLMSVKGMRINGCFPAGSPVTLENGTTKPIETVQIGERVLTSQGRIKPVVDVFRRDDADHVVVLRCGTKHSELRLTPNHRVWAIKGLRVTHHVAENGGWLKTPHEPLAEWIEAGHLSVGDYVEVPCDLTVRDNPKWSPDFCRLLGFYLAEGSASGKEGHLHHVDFSLHRKEKAYADFIHRECIAAFGKARHSLPRTRPTSRVVTVDSSCAARMLVDLCGKGAGGKRLHQDLLTLPPKKQREILLGWLLGDGYTTTHGRNKQGIVVSGKTISRPLIEQLRLIALRCGWFSSVHCLEIGASSRGHTSYALLFTGETARIVAHELGEYIPDVHDLKRNRPSDYKFISHAGAAYARVTEAWIEAYTGPVFNLTVEDDHTYVVNGVGVANSGKGYDEWALSMGFDFEPPAQDLWITHPDHAITAEWPVYVDSGKGKHGTSHSR